MFVYGAEARRAEVWTDLTPGLPLLLLPQHFGYLAIRLPFASFPVAVAARLDMVNRPHNSQPVIVMRLTFFFEGYLARSSQFDGFTILLCFGPLLHRSRPILASGKDCLTMKRRLVSLHLRTRTEDRLRSFSHSSIPARNISAC